MKNVHAPLAALHGALLAGALYLAGLSPDTIHALHLSPGIEQLLIGVIFLAGSLTSPLKKKAD